MAYEYETRVRYSEIGADDRIRLSALLNYLQDTSTFHSHDCGVSIDSCRLKRRAWFITYWDIRIGALPGDADRILCGTSPYDMKGIFAYRNFWLKDADRGQFILKADSVWFLCNLDTMLPTRLTGEDIAPFEPTEDVLGIKTPTRKVEAGPAEDYTLLEELPVCFDMLDRNHHVNNIRYITLAWEALANSGMLPPNAADRQEGTQTFGEAQAFREAQLPYPSRIRAEYKLAAAAGDRFRVLGRQEENRFTVLLESPDQRDFCHIEFTI